MKCPHCSVAFHVSWTEITTDQDDKGNFKIWKDKCPECNNVIIELVRIDWNTSLGGRSFTISDELIIYPKYQIPHQIPPEVPKKYADDFREASLTLEISPKASAALSRRCLESLLQNEAKIDLRNLAAEINEAKERKLFPSYIEASLDQVRIIGRFAAHPITSQTSGEIIDVNPGEAECNLSAIEHLFDHFFVQPEKLKQNQLAIEKKLKEAKKIHK